MTQQLWGNYGFTKAELFYNDTHIGCKVLKIETKFTLLLTKYLKTKTTLANVWKNFQVQMYQGTGELKIIFKVQSQVHKWLINQSSNSITSTGVMILMSNVNHFQLK